MTLEELFRAAADGCRVVGCAHKHAGPMFLHAKCHPRAGTFVTVEGRTLHVECATCKKLVVEIAGEPSPSIDAVRVAKVVREWIQANGDRCPSMDSIPLGQLLTCFDENFLATIADALSKEG